MFHLFSTIGILTMEMMRQLSMWRRRKGESKEKLSLMISLIIRRWVQYSSPAYYDETAEHVKGKITLTLACWVYTLTFYLFYFRQKNEAQLVLFMAFLPDESKPLSICVIYYTTSKYLWNIKLVQIFVFPSIPK